MNHAIFVVTYAKDAPWLEHCLRSITKFAKGFSTVTVVVPKQDAHVFGPICDLHGARLGLGNEPPSPLGHLWHNIQKCRADEWCPNADFILHTDADCIFREPVSPEDYFIGGKPVLLVRKYAGVEKSNPGYPWRPAAQRALKRPLTWDTMCRHPMVNPRCLYPMVREAVEKTQGRPFDDYVFAQKPTYPCGFAEFSTMGGVIMETDLCQSYHLIDVDKEPWPRSKLIQFWSHGGLEADQEIWLDGQKIKVKPIEVIRKHLG